MPKVMSRHCGEGQHIFLLNLLVEFSQVLPFLHGWSYAADAARSWSMRYVVCSTSVFRHANRQTSIFTGEELGIWSSLVTRTRLIPRVFVLILSTPLRWRAAADHRRHGRHYIRRTHHLSIMPHKHFIITNDNKVETCNMPVVLSSIHTCNMLRVPDSSYLALVHTCNMSAIPDSS